MNQKSRKLIFSFRRVSLITTVAVFFLILVGGIVRSTGAGMGCPDWPKCFGSWVPPTSVDQLPKNYAEIYVAQRVEKNERFASLLDNLGFSVLAAQIEQDESILDHEPFNATKTWIEYVNRLLGAVIGLLIILTFVYSLRLWKIDPYSTLLAFLALVVVVFQGWLGSIVVSTNLLQWMISVHMIVALLLVCLLLYIYFRSGTLIEASGQGSIPRVRRQVRYRWLLGVGILLMLAQVILGTQVREHIDLIASRFDYSDRYAWIAELGTVFYVHRSFSLVLLALHGYLVFRAYQERDRLPDVFRQLALLLGLLLIVILTGILMAYFGIPAFIQPLHLLLGSLIVGIQYYVWLKLGCSQVRTNKNFALV
ncbi:cytochrome c oxidase assembly protein subunit 15 [Cyclobacterium lianum]|uniref:Cytochrome c oxidase assembly protein subunit 15 n=1 Tax=Cyclobacterium lianum TaxID=388280 RepID=A0A1M7JY22_9BACT|nr:COX15/CtaA family protein [Cyclobacterium lianum]SHM57888.1 cytochrome c oxidase assembly protein subunit 15 [Cyclobacterium lianum]